MIIAIKDFELNGEYYFVNDEVKNLDYETIVKLNEKGFIKPLSTKDLMIIKKNLKKEENNGTTI